MSLSPLGDYVDLFLPFRVLQRGSYLSVFLRGSFATVRIGTNKETKQVVAIKTIKRDHPNYDYELLQNEIQVMKKIKHCRGSLQLHDVYEDPDAVHLIEELALGGELLDRILDTGSFNEKLASNLFKQVPAVRTLGLHPRARARMPRAAWGPAFPYCCPQP